jgi:flagellar protein FlgJ
MNPISAAASAAKAPVTKAEERRLREAAREIEAVFVQQLLKAMRQASPRGGVLSGTGQRVYQDMMDEQLGRAMAKGGGLGLADMLVRDVLRRQGVQKNPSSEAAAVPITPEGGKP